MKSKLIPSLPLIRVKQNPAINSRLMFQWGAKVMPHNWVCKYMYRDRPITITNGLRFGFKIKSHKFPGMLILVLVLVLKDSLRTFFKSLSLSWSLGVRVQEVLVLVLVLWGQVLVLILILVV